MTSAESTHAPLTTLTVGTFTPSVLLAVARRTGALDAAGLAVDERPVTSSPGQFAALRDGELDVAITSPDNVLAYRFSPGNPLGARLDVSIVSGVDRGVGLGLYARPGIEHLDQLRGGVMGVDVPVSGFALALYALADALGVGREDYRLETLGSTPRRLEALLDGRCDATMLNAGNEIRAEAAGCRLLAAASTYCAPYLGTVVAVLGPTHLDGATRLGEALAATARRVLAGELDDVTSEEAGHVLGLDGDLGRRYTQKLKDPDEGLTAGAVDLDALATLVDLRRRYLPEDGADPWEGALAPGSGLVATTASQG
ncbi:ABC transporter substrate-binding protein [Nocardioides sp. GXQ0305]|uniref:ABC transporter substrate-binding protein n=1 Tax=Nocardioides sp. GXQ0305 TaxID=3423912 RepID=UPI003D7E5EF3